jgi:hypothetical protein
MGSHNIPGTGNPTAWPKGEGSASQQNKHFQRGSATVLCATVNPKASPLLVKLVKMAFRCAATTFLLWQIDTPAPA